MRLRDIFQLFKDGKARYVKTRPFVRTRRPREYSKHSGGKRKPRDWRQVKRRKRKAQKLARRMHRKA